MAMTGKRVGRGLAHLGAMASRTARDQTVTRAELLDFVRPQHDGILLTTRSSGRPQMSPLTIGVDSSERIVAASYPERAKVRNLRRHPQAAFLVLADNFDGEWVLVEGTAEVIDLPDALDGLVEYFRGIAGEHPDWDEYRAAMVRQGKVLIRMTIEEWGPVSRGGFPARLGDGPEA
jgi:PPOX class probable F420-dependent enzyme